MRREWSEYEIRFLRENYLTMKPTNYAEKLNRTASAVYQRAASLGLLKVPHYTEDEVMFIKLNYASMGPQKLSEKMDRSGSAIRDMAVRLNLVVNAKRRSNIAKKTRAKWTDESRAKKSNSQKKYKGPLSPSWKGGVCTVSEVTRGRLIAAWVKYVFQRDDYTCRICNQRGGKLVVHHVRTFSQIRDAVIKENPELNLNNYNNIDRLADLVVEAHNLEDGVTLCRICHKKHHHENGVNCGNILPGNAGDNPQRSSASNGPERSTTRLRVLPGNAGDSNKAHERPTSCSLAG